MVLNGEDPNTMSAETQMLKIRQYLYPADGNWLDIANTMPAVDRATTREVQGCFLTLMRKLRQANYDPQHFEDEERFKAFWDFILRKMPKDYASAANKQRNAEAHPPKE